MIKEQDWALIKTEISQMSNIFERFCLDCFKKYFNAFFKFKQIKLHIK